MSLLVATCACGSQFYRFTATAGSLVREEWDQHFTLAWCRVCQPDRVGASTGLPLLDTVEAKA